MKHINRHLIVAATAAALTVSGALGLRAADAKAKMSVKDVMEKYHKAPKGVDPVCKKVSNGQGSKEDIANLLAGYKAMAAAKPEQGDPAVWKQKTSALVAAMTAVQKGETDGLEKYKAAVNCKSCHEEFKPKKQ